VTPRRAKIGLAGRIVEALKAKMREHEKDAHQLSLERIVLRMDKMKMTVASVKRVFKSYANDKGRIEKANLVRVMGRLHQDLSQEEVDDLFSFVDIDLSSSIDFREFLVALCVCSVLGKLTSDKIGSASPEQSVRKASGLNNLAQHKKEVIEMLDLILSAYLLFDPKGTGSISAKQVDQIIEEHCKRSGGAGSDHYLSKQMWSEMDWNKDGSIDFGEFTYAFSKWTDHNDPEDGEEGENA